MKLGAQVYFTAARNYDYAWRHKWSKIVCGLHTAHTHTHTRDTHTHTRTQDGPTLAVAGVVVVDHDKHAFLLVVLLHRGEDPQRLVFDLRGNLWKYRHEGPGTRKQSTQQ